MPRLRQSFSSGWAWLSPIYSSPCHSTSNALCHSGWVQILWSSPTSFERLCKNNVFGLSILTCISYSRSHSFSIQWPTLFYSHIFPSRSTYFASRLRVPVHHSLMLQAHLFIPRASILLLLATHILFHFHLETANIKYRQTGNRRSGTARSSLRTIHSATTDRCPLQTTLSVSKGTVSRVLGAELLGPLLVCWSRGNSTYLLSLWRWSLVAPYLGLDIKNQTAVSSLTRGLVGDTSFAVLPEVTSRMTFIITLISQLVTDFFLRLTDK